MCLRGRGMIFGAFDVADQGCIASPMISVRVLHHLGRERRHDACIIHIVMPLHSNNHLTGHVARRMVAKRPAFHSLSTMIRSRAGDLRRPAVYRVGSRPPARRVGTSIRRSDEAYVGFLWSVLEWHCTVWQRCRWICHIKLQVFVGISSGASAIFGRAAAGCSPVRGWPGRLLQRGIGTGMECLGRADMNRTRQHWRNRSSSRDGNAEQLQTE